MTSWKRIALVVLVLVGGTMSFGYWSINQFNNALNDLSASYVAGILTASSALKKNTNLASTSPEIAGGFATSTDGTISALTSTTTMATTTPVTATSTNFSFTFPQKGSQVYIGCTYPISWQSSTTIASLGMALVDAGTGEVAGPIASGLAKENTIEKDSQDLDWKMGAVWPGSYYIKVSKINDIEAGFKSKVFEINSMPKGLNTKEREKICKKSGASI